MSLDKFNIKTSVFPFKIRVVIGNDISAVVKYVNKKQHRKGSDKYHSEHFKNNRGRYCTHDIYLPVIWIPSKPKTIRNLCTISHEILHAVFDCMEYVGVGYSRQSEESFTYMQSYLMKQFLKKCKYK